MRKLVVLAILAVLVGGGYWAVVWSGRAMVELVLPERGSAVRAVYATGVVEPENWAAVAHDESLAARAQRRITLVDGKIVS